jgi:hypothetical protein
MRMYGLDEAGYVTRILSVLVEKQVTRVLIPSDVVR